MAAKQQTLKAPISFSGTGLHTGVKVTMTVHPAPENSGIVFRRIDLEGKPEIPALCDYVTDTSRGTTIEKGGARVATIEHIMSALWTLGVDNATIDVDAGETPIMDGSAKEYAKTIVETGLQPQEAERTYYHVTEKWSIRFRKRRGHHPLPRRRILRIAARGLQLQGDRQPVRDLQSRRRLRLENRALPHLRLPA